LFQIKKQKGERKHRNTAKNIVDSSSILPLYNTLKL